MRRQCSNTSLKKKGTQKEEAMAVLKNSWLMQFTSWTSWYLVLLMLLLCISRVTRTENNIMNQASSYRIRSVQEGEANLLILHSIYAGSHDLVLRHLGEELVKRGFNVTQIRFRSTNTIEVLDSPVNVITLSPDNHDLRYPYMTQNGTFQPPTNMLWERPRRMWQIPTDVWGLIDAHCETLLNDQVLLQRLRSAAFTVALVDVIANECSQALARTLGLPVVGYWGTNFQGGEARAAGVFQSPALVPVFMSEVGVPMTFWERLWNTGVALAEKIVITYHFHRVDQHIKSLVPGCPASQTLLADMEAVLVHCSWYTDYPKLLPPHVQYIGCINCGPPNSLPVQLENWMAGAGDAGVVLFSLGFTGYEAETVPTRIMDAFIGAFARLKQRVVVRFNPRFLKRIPDNVMVANWIPQHDILGDPRTLLFVTHCGQTGINEALYHGVPMVGMPIFGDQGDNARRLLDHGLGLVLSKVTITQENAFQAIIEVIENPAYRAKTRWISAQWKEESESGLERAVSWIQRVHRYGRLSHLHMPGADLWLFQYLGLDTMCLVGFMVLSPWFLLVWLCSLGFKKRSKKEKIL